MLTFLLWILAYLLADLAWHRRADRRRAAAFAVGGFVALGVSLALLPSLLVLGKVAGRLAMPVGMLWTALGAVGAWHWSHRNKRAAAAWGAAFVALGIVGNAHLGGRWLAALEAPYVERDGFAGPPLDAVFALGGSTAESPRDPRPRLGDAGDRLLTAARVFKAREVGVLVTSGSSIPGIGPRRDVADEAAQILIELGVPAEDIVEIPEPVNSAQEVAEYARLARDRGWSRVGVVTSAWHLRRVMRLCERAGLDAEPIPADFRGDTQWHGLLSVIPDGQGFLRTQRAAWELLGAAVGR